MFSSMRGVSWRNKKKFGLKSRCYQFTPHFDMKNAPRRATFDRGAEICFRYFTSLIVAFCSLKLRDTQQ